jgi:hypothetical protein
LADKEFQVRKGLIVANTVLVTNGSNVGINTSNPNVSFQVATTDAIALPVGTDAQRPTPQAGYIRYNSNNDIIEAYTVSSGWQAIGPSGGFFRGNFGSVGSANSVQNLFRINANTQSNNITIAAGENASATGPISIQVGYTLTIQTGGRAVIL